jgi:hypothetical protein
VVEVEIGGREALGGVVHPLLTPRLYLFDVLPPVPEKAGVFKANLNG